MVNVDTAEVWLGLVYDESKSYIPCVKVNII